MIEIRIHGRGGQGAVTTSQLLSIAAFLDGKQSQGFPAFGVEREGAPANSFVRIDDSVINVRSQVYNPDVVLVLDASLLSALDVAEGLKKNGLCIVNTAKKPTELKLGKGFKVYTFDATALAMSVFGKPIINTVIVGAYAAVSGAVSLDSLLKACDQRFKGDIAEKNKAVIKKAYEAMKHAV
jgi:pyruvate ferredoxin oxidoreductase gamma subunit